MAGNTTGGKRAATTNKERWGENFYAKIGAIGGSRKGNELNKPKGFAADLNRASWAGRKGGQISKRTKKAV